MDWFRPDRYDIAGALISIIGVAVIMCATLDMTAAPYGEVRTEQRLPESKRSHEGSRVASGTPVRPYLRDMSRTTTVRRRLAVAAGSGVVATLAMTAVMLAGVATGVSPMPDPIPVALVTRALGSLPQPATLGLAVVAHLGYGAAAAVVLVALVARVTAWVGVGYGILLWAVMGLLWLPYLGWGLFGTAVTAKIVGATLLLHVVYGLTLGLLLDRQAAPRSADEQT